MNRRNAQALVLSVNSVVDKARGYRKKRGSVSKVGEQNDWNVRRVHQPSKTSSIVIAAGITSRSARVYSEVNV